MSEYTEIKTSKYSGFNVGLIGNQYVISIPMGICDIPEYYPLTKEEFETFFDWYEDLNKLYEIEKRAPVK